MEDRTRHDHDADHEGPSSPRIRVPSHRHGSIPPDGSPEGTESWHQKTFEGCCGCPHTPHLTISLDGRTAMVSFWASAMARPSTPVSAGPGSSVHADQWSTASNRSTRWRSP